MLFSVFIVIFLNKIVKILINKIVEKMTLVLRYMLCNEESGLCEIKESFVGSIKVIDKAGQGISDAILNEPKALGLDPNCL